MTTKLSQLENNPRTFFIFSLIGILLFVMTPLFNGISPFYLVLIALVPGFAGALMLRETWDKIKIELIRARESDSGSSVATGGVPPRRDALEQALDDASKGKKSTLEKYLIGWKTDDGSPIWISDSQMTQHVSVFGEKNSAVSQLFLSIALQQMARGRASGLTYLQGSGNHSLLSELTLLAIINGRLEDLIVISPEEPCHTYNPLLKKKSARFKAQIASQVIGKAQTQIIHDALTRIIKGLDSTELSWTMRDLAASLSDFGSVYPRLRAILSKNGNREALADLAALASLFLDQNEQNLNSFLSPLAELANFGRELQAYTGDKAFDSFNSSASDLDLREAITNGKIIYFMLPDIKNEAKNRAIETLYFEDLITVMQEISAGKVERPQDPHLVFLDHSPSQSSYDFRKLFELASRTQISLLFGGHAGGQSDNDVGPSREFYQRVISHVKTKILLDSQSKFSTGELSNWFGKAVTQTTPDYRLRDSIKAPFSSAQREDEPLMIGYSGADVVSDANKEKGLAWFDLGAGGIMKGRVFSVQVEVPDHWDPYVFMNKSDRPATQSLGVSKWLKQKALEDLERELQSTKMSLVGTR